MWSDQFTGYRLKVACAAVVRRLQFPAKSLERSVGVDSLRPLYQSTEDRRPSLKAICTNGKCQRISDPEGRAILIFAPWMPVGFVWCLLSFQQVRLAYLPELCFKKLIRCRRS